MRYDTHVFLGPTLTVQSAINHLHQAHYHPPIKCGDLIRLFRLNPKRIVIIDGIYESIPAVWHKEILLGLDNGIEIFGAASMGALRAAELYPFGMIGMGKVFQDFLEKRLNDDDEVAVLHQSQALNYAPINDAMVNIRATLELAQHENIISLATRERLIADCKAQFYPYRSLEKSIKRFEKNSPNDDCRALSFWLTKNGLVDVKRQDAQLMLSHVQTMSADRASSTINSTMPVTKFIASLIDDAVLEPFDFREEWLPEQEKQLLKLSQENETTFQIVQIIASLIKILIPVASSEKLSLNEVMLLEYIDSNELYSPEHDFRCIKEEAKFSPLYALICQQICQGHLKNQAVKDYLPVASFYFQFEFDQPSSHAQQLLRIIVVLICVANNQLGDRRLKIKPSVLADHLRDMRLWPRFNRYNESYPQHRLDKYALTQFIVLYMQVIYVYQGTRDCLFGAPDTPRYFNWLYDAHEFYQLIINSGVI